MEMGKMEQRKRGRAKYHNFQGCRRGQFLMMVFILSKPSSSFFFSHYVMKWGKKKISLFLHYFVPPFSFARDMVMEKARARYRERQTLVAFATCMAQERLQWFLHLICSRFRVTENGNSLMSGRISILESQGWWYSLSVCHVALHCIQRSPLHLSLLEPQSCLISITA